MFRLVLTFCTLVVFSANAQIRVYDPNTGKDQTIDYLVESGAVDLKGNRTLTESQKRVLAAKQIEQDIQKHAAKINKQILFEEPTQKAKLGSIAIFADFALKKKQGKLIDQILDIDGIDGEFYMKAPKNPMTLMSLAVELEGVVSSPMSMDTDGIKAQKYHVTRYPEVIYINPFGQKFRLPLSKQGIATLNIKLQEVRDSLKDQKIK